MSLQGHRLARTASPHSHRGVGGISAATGGNPSEGVGTYLDEAYPADGRPAWDPRFYLERTSWESQPRTQLLRPPSTNPYPGSGTIIRATGGQSGSPSFRRPQASYTGATQTGGDGGFSPSGRRASIAEGTDSGTFRSSGHVIGSVTDGNGTRSTILPGLHVAAPPMWQSPYADTLSSGAGSGAGVGLQTSVSVSLLAGPSGVTAISQPPRLSRADLAESYIGRAYSPDQSYFRSSVDGVGQAGSLGGCRNQSQMRGEAAAQAATKDDTGGVDGHGTHLPSLERAGYAKGPSASVLTAKELDARAATFAAMKASAQATAIQALGAVYMPGGGVTKLLRGTGGTRDGAGARSPPRVAAPPPLTVGVRSCRSTEEDGSGGRSGAVSARATAISCGASGVSDRGRDVSPGAIWRPSGRQPIPETAPPVPRHTQQSSSGEPHETQEVGWGWGR